MEIISAPAAMTAWSNARQREGQTIAFVPTMGCLHAGHEALMRTAAGLADLLVVSVFVNPLQFGPHEDFSRYPRPFAHDCQVVAANGGRVLFAPEVAAFYPAGFQTAVRVSGLSAGLCGASRPGHFDGVTTVVAKLFHVIKPTLAVFGQKDFQQLAVIKAMVRDLDWDIDIVGHPIVREADGLAMSSRNRYLSAVERRSALCLPMALASARQMVAAGQRDADSILACLRAQISADPLLDIDYLAIVTDDSLLPQAQVDQRAVLALAVRIGQTRLIDNGYLIDKE